MFHKKRGFTLVELLVVIAVIGLLASIILVSLNTARNRAKNSAIKASLAELRIAAEWEYDQVESYISVCDDGDGGETFVNDINDDPAKNFEKVRQSIITNGGTDRYCRDGTNTDGDPAWCARVTAMPAGGNWCVDYTGYSGSTAACDGTNYNCP